MTMVQKSAVAATAFALICATSAGVQAQSAPAFEFSIAGGAGIAPEYSGSDQYRAVPVVGLSFGFLNFNNFQLGAEGGAKYVPGFAIGPSFNLRDERISADHAELAGLPDIDRAYELGLRVSYTTEDWQVFGTVRRGFDGHTGITGEIGGDIIFRPSDKWTLNLGPRASFGNGEFANTYYGVAAGGTVLNTPYTASGGMISSGFELGAQYRINRDWAVEGAVTYDRMRGSAESSPIVAAGSRDQFGASINLRRYFRIGG